MNNQSVWNTCHTKVYACLCACVLCMCVCERERECVCAHKYECTMRITRFAISEKLWRALNFGFDCVCFSVYVCVCVCKVYLCVSYEHAYAHCLYPPSWSRSWRILLWHYKTLENLPPPLAPSFCLLLCPKYGAGPSNTLSIQTNYS